MLENCDVSEEKISFWLPKNVKPDIFVIFGIRENGPQHKGTGYAKESLPQLIKVRSQGILINTWIEKLCLCDWKVDIFSLQNIVFLALFFPFAFPGSKLSRKKVSSYKNCVSFYIVFQDELDIIFGFWFFSHFCIVWFWNIHFTIFVRVY